MRVLFVTNTFPPGYTGGAEVANYHTCRALIRQGVDCSILVLNNRAPEYVDEWYELGGIPVHRVTHRWPRSALTDVFDPRLFRVAVRELLRLKPDLVHIHNVSGATLAPYLACRQVGIPVVNTLHDLWLLCPNNMLYRQDGSFCDPRQNPRGCARCFRRYDYWGDIPYRRQVFKAITSHVRAFVSPSQALIDRHVEAGYERERFRLVRLGLERQAPQEVAQLHPEPARGSNGVLRTLVFAGGGVEIKGANVVLQALPALLQRVEGLRVVIAGGGEARLLALFRQFGPSVEVWGNVPFASMHALYASADLTLVPSVSHENSPVVIYESCEAGTPVVGSRIGGIPELVHEGETGYLFPTGDPVALAETIVLHFSRPPIERRRMRQACVREMRTRLTLEKHVRGLMRVYEEVLGS